MNSLPVVTGTFSDGHLVDDERELLPVQRLVFILPGPKPPV
jgi:hypothetical protein